MPESRAVPRKQTRLSLVWTIPIVAALVGVWVAVARIRSEGPKITIVFQSAEGLEAGKTKINYRGVDIGTISGIRLTEDHQRVMATAQMAPKTEDFLVEDTRMWVVRPRISGANVTGLGTLISGAYIGVEIGSSKEPRREFVALDTPPIITGNVPGRFFVLKTPDLGSLDTGTPMFFRRLQVGQVSSYALDKDGQSFTLKVFVRAPYDQLRHPKYTFLAGERGRSAAFGQWPQRADPIAAVDPDRRNRVRNAAGRPDPARGRGRTPSSRCTIIAPRPSSRRRAVRRPLSSSSTNRSAGWRRARRWSFAAFRSARFRRFVHKSI